MARRSTKKKVRVVRTSPAPPGTRAARPRPSHASRGGGLKAHCRSLPGTTEDVKWGDDLVFSVGGKMYAAFDLDDEDEFGFKCDDIDFERLTKRDGIIPAPYAARFGWVKVKRRGALPESEARRLLAKAHGLVASRLPKKTRAALGLT
jgi:predicted DNA-binding protein (MmcQ/YjbR family)